MKETMKESMPNFNELSRILDKTSLKLHPSQVHGLICGILCGKSKQSSAWENLVAGGEVSAKSHEILQQVYNQSTQQLEDFLFEFQLVLPADSNPLPERAEALTLWCQGFLTGLKFAEIPIVAREASEVTEAINDLIEIAKMQYEEVVDSEEDEAAFVELVEYVRMAVVLIYQTLHEANPVQRTDSSQHLH